MADMTPEQMAEELERMREQVNRTEEALRVLAGGVNSTTGYYNRMNSSLDQNSNSLNSFGKSTRDATEVQKAQTAAAKEEAVALALRKKAFDNLGAAASSLTASLLTAGGGLQKYNSTIDKAGDAVSGMAKQFGPLGKAIGLIVDGATWAAKQLTVYADNVLKASDELASFGAAGTLSTSQIADMGAKALYTSTTIAGWTKATKSLGTDIMGLSTSVTGGVTEFSKLTALTREQYNIYQTMGVSQEQLTQNQADYVKLQAISGKQITERMKADGSLKKASLEYTDNLLQLSAITGQTIDESKKSIERATASDDIMLKTNMMQQEANRLRETGNAQDKIHADAIDKEIAMRNKMLVVAEMTKDKDILAATQSFLATGAYTEQSKVLIQMGIDMDGFSQRIKKGEDVSSEFANAIVKATDSTAQTIGPSGVFNKDIRKTFGLTNETLSFAAKYRGKDFEKINADAEAARKLAAAGQGPAATDPLQKMRTTQLEAEFKLQAARDKLITSIGMEDLATKSVILTMGSLVLAAGGAALALQKLGIGGLASGAASTGAKGVAGRFLGMGGGFAGGAEAIGTPVATTKAAGRARDAAGRFVKAVPGGGASDALGKIAGPLKRSPQAGSSTGQFISNTMKGFGKGTELLMQGMAKGLAAFANPQILLGATILGGSITVIGAGIAGASWLMGKALPTFAKGIKAFSEIDGENLVEVAKGIGALGLSMAAMGAGGAVGAIGNAVSSVVGSLTKLFGGDDIITKITKVVKELAPVTPELVKLGPAIGEFGKGMLDWATAIDKLDIEKAKRANSVLSTTKVPSGAPTAGPAAAGPNIPESAAPVEEAKKPAATPHQTKPSVAAPFKPGDQKDFYDQMYNVLLKEAKAAKVANPESIAHLGATQSSLETGYGKHLAGGNNFFGIKAKRGQSATGGAATQEWDPKQRKMVTINDKFRKYEDPTGGESAKDYIKFLQENKRYKEVLASKSAKEAIDAQSRTGYATDPKYGEKLNAIYSRGQASIDKASPMPKAKGGGIFNGPDSGFPVELHGSEVVTPFNPSSLLAQLMLAPASESAAKITSAAAPTTNPMQDSMMSMTTDMIDMLSTKLDTMIDKLSTSNYTQEKMLQYSKA